MPKRPPTRRPIRLSDAKSMHGLSVSAILRAHGPSQFRRKGRTLCGSHAWPARALRDCNRRCGDDDEHGDPAQETQHEPCGGFAADDIRPIQ